MEKLLKIKKEQHKVADIKFKCNEEIAIKMINLAPAQVKKEIFIFKTRDSFGKT